MPGGLSEPSAPSSPQDQEAAGLLLEAGSEPTVFPSPPASYALPRIFSPLPLFLRLFFSLSISFSRSYCLSPLVSLPHHSP